MEESGCLELIGFFVVLAFCFFVGYNCRTLNNDYRSMVINEYASGKLHVDTIFTINGKDTVVYYEAKLK